MEKDNAEGNTVKEKGGLALSFHFRSWLGHKAYFDTKSI